MSARRGRRRLLAAVGLLLVGVLGGERLRALASVPPTDFDDAYMYARYAQHWLDGHGLAWNPGERPVYGVTSLLHVGLVALLRACFAELSAAAVLRLASGSASIALLVALVAVLARSSRHPSLQRNWVLWSLVVLPLIAHREAFLFHGTTGMDTMLSALANTGVAFATVALARADILRASGIVLAAAMAVTAVLARPDNLLCAMACPMLAIGVPVEGQHRPGRLRALALFVAVAGGAACVLALVEWRWLGSPLPLSFFAKQPRYYGGFAGEFGWNPYRFLDIFGALASPFILAVAVLGDRRAGRRALVLTVPPVATLVALGRFNQIMGHLARFDYPFLPFFVVAGGLAVDGWLDRLRSGERLRRSVLVTRAVTAVAGLAMAHVVLGAAARAYDAKASTVALASVGGFRVESDEPLPEMDSWQAAGSIAAIAAQAPPGARFAMSEHGLPGALAPNAHIIDVLGLHDPVFARGGFSATELFRRQPDFVWMPHDDHTFMVRDIVTSDALWKHYVFYPGAFFYGVAVRVDGPLSAELHRLLAEQWRKAYPGVPMEAHRAIRTTP